MSLASRLAKELNNYFFGQDSISLSDWLWFYSSIIFATIITLLSVIFGILT